VTLIDGDSPNPLLKMHLNPPVQPGVQRVRLADYGVRLVPEKQYQWFVSLMLDPSRACEEVSGGGIARIAPNSRVMQLLDQLFGPQRLCAKHAEYAEAGLWYDAIAALSDCIEAAPRDATLRQRRAALLEQVGLSAAAAYDLRR
jgi:hypothetical protein